MNKILFHSNSKKFNFKIKIDIKIIEIKKIEFLPVSEILNTQKLNARFLKKSKSEDDLRLEENVKRIKKNSVGPESKDNIKKNYQEILKDIEKKEFEKEKNNDKESDFKNESISKKIDDKDKNSDSQNKKSKLSQIQKHIDEVDQIVLMNK